MAGAIALKSKKDLVDAVNFIQDIAPTEVFVDIFKININLALRISDLMKLRYSDFEDGQYLTIKQKKTKRYVNIKITDHVRELVQSRRTKNPNDEFVFESDYPRYKGKPLTIRRVQQVFREVAQVYMDGAKFSTHSMRKSPARIMWENDVPLEQISEILGHKSIDITKRYLGLTQDDVDETWEENQFIL